MQCEYLEIRTHSSSRTSLLRQSRRRGTIFEQSAGQPDTCATVGDHAAAHINSLCNREEPLFCGGCKRCHLPLASHGITGKHHCAQAKVQLEDKRSGAEPIEQRLTQKCA